MIPVAKCIFPLLTITFCMSLKSYEPDPSFNATKELGKFTIGTCVVVPQIMLMGGNWGGFAGLLLYHHCGKQAVAHPNIDTILPNPFSIIETNAPNRTYQTAYLFGMFGGACAIGLISIPHIVSALSPGRYFQTIATITGISILHCIAYPLAKHIVQKHIDRTYYQDLTRGA